MISRISGKVTQRAESHLILETGDICYEVLVPQTVMHRLDENIDGNGRISLVTFHYLQTDQSKSIPVLIGFLNEIEKDFFQTFITVSGIGPRAALRALNKPISLIAQAIDEGDLAFLKTLPGIGEQRAKEIIAKLQNKVGKFGLIKDGGSKKGESQKLGLVEEAAEVLMQLEYKKPEAMAMIKKAMESSSGIETTEELLNLVYKQRRSR